jgi:hypothetical protein
MSDESRGLIEDIIRRGVLSIEICGSVGPFTTVTGSIRCRWEGARGRGGSHVPTACFDQIVCEMAGSGAGRLVHSDALERDLEIDRME